MPLFPCDPQALINSAVCFDKCIPPGAQREVALMLLCNWAQAASAPTPVPPPTYPCGVPSNTIQISGAGRPGVDGNYVWDAPSGSWVQLPAHNCAIQTDGVNYFLVDFSTGASDYYNSSAANFPCIWTVGNTNQPPAPTGQYIPDSP